MVGETLEEREKTKVRLKEDAAEEVDGFKNNKVKSEELGESENTEVNSENSEVKLVQLVRQNSLQTNLPAESFIQRCNSWPQGSRVSSIEDVTVEDKDTLSQSFTKAEFDEVFYDTFQDNDAKLLHEKEQKEDPITFRVRCHSYENVHLDNYADDVAKNFHALQRYYVTSTLPNRNSRLVLEMRALGVDRLNICLFGGVGCGKSALVNTMYAAMTSQHVEYSAERKLGKRYRASVTRRRVEMRLTENISVVDNIGVDFSKRSLTEMRKQCEGLREMEEEISTSWKVTMGQRGRDIVKHCGGKRYLLRNRVHCPIVVSSITQELNKNAMKKLVNVLKQSTYCVPVIVIAMNIHDVEHTRTYMAASRRNFFESLGCQHIHEVDLYTSSNHKHKHETDRKIIQLLFQCCVVGDKTLSTTLENIDKYTSCC